MHIVLLIRVLRCTCNPASWLQLVLINKLQYKLQRNLGAASAEVLQDNLVLSSELMMQSGLRKDFPKLMFRALALHQSKTLLLVLIVGYSVYTICSSNTGSIAY